MDEDEYASKKINQKVMSRLSCCGWGLCSIAPMLQIFRMFKKCLKMFQRFHVLFYSNRWLNCLYCYKIYKTLFLNLIFKLVLKKKILSKRKFTMPFLCHDSRDTFCSFYSKPNPTQNQPKAD